MQDDYVGDIGDYGKYGLLRAITDRGISLGINWYRVIPERRGKQADGKYTEYLTEPRKYRRYAPELFDTLYQIVNESGGRRIERVESSGIVHGVFYHQVISKERELWHSSALEQLDAAEMVFLDPDNGLETERMYQSGKTTQKHVRWAELKDYYDRGQNVILYQHRPQMTTKQDCVQAVMDFQRRYLNADGVQILEYPKYTNRFYFFFLHQSARKPTESLCRQVAEEWKGMCNLILPDTRNMPRY